MDAKSIVIQLKQELVRLDRAISALEQLDETAPRRGRPPKALQAGRRGPRTMSAAARAKIAAAQRARWAKQKKATPINVSAKKAASKRKPMSPAMRKKLSAMMKARWAARKKAA